MKKIFLFMLAMIFAWTAGANVTQAQGKILVAYFSRTGNEYSVGNITKGNTQIVAEIIQKKTGADIFRIDTVQKYPTDYDETTKVASREKAKQARPALTAKVDDFAQYDTIFLGYPIWWGDMPMAVYTFLESYDFGGKTIIPFCTHGGSGLSSTEQQITLKCPNAKLLQGFELRGATAQKNPAEAEQKVSAWLDKINY